MKHNYRLALSITVAAPLALAATTAPPLPDSAGVYRLPYADGTHIKIFDDASTHRPYGRIDMTGAEGKAPYRIVAAADGQVMAIQDNYGEQQSGRAAADCRNNFIWIAHDNGEWTNYSHLRQGSISQGAKLRVGDRVKAGTYLGDEGTVGCSMLEHLHFEVAVPDANKPIDAGGFLLDNDNSKRERNARFCNVTGAVIKNQTYIAAACPVS
ncbi:MAG TPA: M23 family metallopeptidase [Steroidobacter sp.]|uniref:M23 family metallopeptidase n=1 Tax=Steroidobacter sp. TaxID=1978227 RepID=UPI002ED96B6D